MNRVPPLAIDLFCGLGGWTEGLLAEGYRVVGFDIHRHDYGDGERYPAQLVLQDVRTINGAQFSQANLIVAIPPCQEYSYRAMPWKRSAKPRRPLVVTSRSSWRTSVARNRGLVARAGTTGATTSGVTYRP